MKVDVQENRAAGMAAKMIHLKDLFMELFSSPLVLNGSLASRCAAAFTNKLSSA